MPDFRANHRSPQAAAAVGLRPLQPHEQLCGNLLRLLAERGLPLADLAASLGKDPLSASLTLADLADIAARLGCKISDLFKPL